MFLITYKKFVLMFLQIRFVVLKEFNNAGSGFTLPKKNLGFDGIRIGSTEQINEFTLNIDIICFFSFILIAVTIV